MTDFLLTSCAIPGKNWNTDTAGHDMVFGNTTPFAKLLDLAGAFDFFM